MLLANCWQVVVSSVMLLMLLAHCCQVVGIMRVNVEKVLERDQKLSELDTRAGNAINNTAATSLLIVPLC